MNTFIIAILGVTGIWLTSTSLIVNTKDIKSSLFFKVIPFFLGAGCVFACGKLAGLY
jgi:hypothetical protein